LSEHHTRRRILLVDDEQDIITTFKTGLEETGLFEVDAFTDPQLALSNLERFGLSYYDLLLIDVKMPQINGFELYQEIKRKFRDSITKVCFITAYEIYYETLKNEFPTLNVGCFIKKPIEMQNLIIRLKQELQLQ
jgi:two-component system, OmpR family, response regulator ChvI